MMMASSLYPTSLSPALAAFVTLPARCDERRRWADSLWLIAPGLRVVTGARASGERKLIGPRYIRRVSTGRRLAVLKFDVSVAPARCSLDDPIVQHNSMQGQKDTTT